MKLTTFLFAICMVGVAALQGIAVPIIHSTIPKVGTLFVNTYYVTDSSGAVVQMDSTDPKIADDSLWIAQSDARLQGKNHTVMILAKSHPDTTFLSFAKNGDVYVLNTRKLNSWQRLPFSAPIGKQIRTAQTADDGHVLGNYYALTRYDIMHVVGRDTMDVAGMKRVPTIHLEIVNVMEYDTSKMATAPQGEYRNAINYWYAPSIGYFARINFGWNTSYFLNQELKTIGTEESYREKTR